MSIKVLLIEDDSVARNMLKRVIEREGYEIILATDGHDGLNKFKSEKPDIVITDINMPRMNGLEVMRKVKEISPSTEIILITGHGDYEIAVLALQEGALDYIKKPINLDDIILSLGRAKEKILQKRKIGIKNSILILEDDKNTRDKLAKIFEKEGYMVYTGADGEEGVDIFSNNKIDILIVDINMPKKSGIEVLNEVKQASKNFEIILLTGYGDENTAIQAMRCGAINYLRKPIDVEQLILAVQKAFDKLHLRRAYLYQSRELELTKQIIAKLSEEKDLEIQIQDYAKISSNDFALKLINILPISIILINEHLKVDFVNQHFFNVYEYRPEQIDSNILNKIGLKHYGEENFLEAIKKIFNGKEKIAPIQLAEERQIVIFKVSLVTNEEKKERALIMLGGE